ncbi:hypothetical protein QTP70_018289, partial [Hemibagrus guttatus]
MSVSLDLRLKRANKVYHEGEVLAGVVVITSKEAVQHQGISLTMEGLVNLQLSSKSVGVFEAFYNSVKPIQLISSNIEVAKPGKVPGGKTEIPFEFPLQAKGNKVLYETYHGVFVNIQYTLRCDMKRPLLAKDQSKTCEFMVHCQPQKSKVQLTPVDFTITPETLQNVREKSSLPKFLIRGHLDATNCVITQPLTGELVVESSEVAIKSIELQLVRVETCGCAEGYARDATEIQNIQIAEGDVCHGLPIPIYMVFPRLFTCPTLETTNFKVVREHRAETIYDPLEYSERLRRLNWGRGGTWCRSSNVLTGCWRLMLLQNETETWISSHNTATPAAPSSAYAFSHSPRESCRGGGTGMLLFHISLLNNHHDPNHSGFKAAHSTETALLAVTKEPHAAISAKLSSVLILLNLSAAFDTVNHKTLLSILRSLRIRGTAWEWFAGHSYQVTWRVLASSPRRLSTGVPQGSVLDTTASAWISAYLQTFHQLKLNPSKTELLVIS